MKKRFLAAGWIVWLLNSLVLAGCFVGSILITINQTTKSLNTFGDYFGNYFIVIICWVLTITWLAFLATQVWIVEIDEKGMIYRNYFKLSKFTRQMDWNSVDEIEIINMLFIKRLHITNTHMPFEQKIVAIGKNENLLIFACQKRALDTIKQFYSKDIINGRKLKDFY